MDHYEIWCNLRNSHKDMEFAEAVAAYLGRLKDDGRIDDFRLRRRKFGFGPPELGEFNITIDVTDLTQLDSAFDIMAARSGAIERLHKTVYAMVTDFRAGLCRDFPDPQRLNVSKE